jgi:hypothetical protein
MLFIIRGAWLLGHVVVVVEKATEPRCTRRVITAARSTWSVGVVWNACTSSAKTKRQWRAPSQSLHHAPSVHVSAHADDCEVEVGDAGTPGLLAGASSKVCCELAFSWPSAIRN